MAKGQTVFDFEDGNGEVPAHKHPNGGGWVSDTGYEHPEHRARYANNAAPSPS